jgi:hypothetical protein
MNLSCLAFNASGPISVQVLESRLLPATNVASYRKIAFRLGFWFSVLLPFVPSAVLLVTCALHAGEDKRIILESSRTTLIVAALFFAKVLGRTCPICPGTTPIPLRRIKERTGNEKFHPSRGRPGPFEREIAHERRLPKLSAL